MDCHGITMTTHQHTQIRTRNGQSWYNDDCTSMDSLCSFGEYGHMDAHSSYHISSHPITSQLMQIHPVGHITSHHITSHIITYGTPGMQLIPSYHFVYGCPRVRTHWNSFKVAATWRVPSYCLVHQMIFIT